MGGIYVKTWKDIYRIKPAPTTSGGFRHGQHGRHFRGSKFWETAKF